MNVKIDKSFEKDILKIKDKKILKRIANCIENIQKVKSIENISGLKKLQGYGNEFRIRISDYRIGIIIDNDIVIFIRCLHRKDIYKYFP